MPEVVASVKGLVKRYGDVLAVNDVSFDVYKGEIFALLGPNGAGKTTTIEILECVREPTAGSVRVFGEVATDAAGSAKVRKRIGVLPQDFNTLGRLTVKENLDFFAGMYDHPVDTEEILGLLNLQEFAAFRFADLSGGLKQRVGVAASLVNDPEVIFLDEPTTGLDPEVRRATWKVIEGLQERGKTILLTTHYMEEAEQLADRIAIMVKGKIAALDSPQALVKTYGGGRSMVFTGGSDATFGTLRRFFETVSMEGDRVVIPFEETRDIQVALTALMERGLQVDMSIRTADIEDVFLRLAGFRIAESGEAK